MPKNKKSLAIVGTVGLPANYGGWETLVDNIVQPLSAEFDVSVFCSAKRYADKLEQYKGAKLEYVNLNANGVESIFYDIVSYWKTRKFDRVLVLGISGCIALPFFRLFYRPIYVLNIDGLEWKRQKWSVLAKTYLRLSEWLGCLASHHLVADNAVIQSYIKSSYKRESALIAYGGDDTETGAALAVPERYASKPYDFSVCRIEPENNSHLILEAFAELPQRNLVFIGNWNSSKYGQNLKAQYSDHPNMELLDPIYDRKILDSYRKNCAIYLHGHSAGGTNPSLVEAMSLELTVLAFDVDFNRETTENAALYFASAADLITVLQQASAADLSKVSAEMKNIAARRYTWDIVAQQYTEFLK